MGQIIIGEITDRGIMAGVIEEHGMAVHSGIKIGTEVGLIMVGEIIEVGTMAGGGTMDGDMEAGVGVMAGDGDMEAGVGAMARDGDMEVGDGIIIMVRSLGKDFMEA